MIPDKIYLKIKDLGSGYVYGISLDDNEEHEYIHKDALIEKISKLRAIPHDNAIARDNAFVEIINIINSIK